VQVGGKCEAEDRKQVFSGWLHEERDRKDNSSFLVPRALPHGIASTTTTSGNAEADRVNFFQKRVDARQDIDSFAVIKVCR
jgi:hypothetical protein